MSIYRWIAICSVAIVVLMTGMLAIVGTPRSAAVSDDTPTSQDDQGVRKSDPSSFEPWAAFLGVVMIGGVLWYIKRGGKEIYLHEPLIKL